MLELSRWIGRAPLQALLEGGSIRSAQKTEFDRLFGEREGSGGAPTPTVWLRKDRPSPSPCLGAAGASPGLGAEEESGVGSAGGDVGTDPASSSNSVWRDVGGTEGGQVKAAPQPLHKNKGPTTTKPTATTTTAITSSNQAALSAAQLREAGREYLDEVDLPKRLKAAAVSGPANDFAVLAGSDKWADQLKALQMVIDILGPTPKVSNQVTM